MKRLFATYRWRVAMAVLLLIAFAPNALFMEHWVGSAATERHSEPVQRDPHAHHGGATSAAAGTDLNSQGDSTHCHVGPESCAASSGLSNAIVISAVLALTLLGGGVMLLAIRNAHVFLFDLERRLMVPPRMNLRSI
jgi:hypothetical protein